MASIDEKTNSSRQPLLEIDHIDPNKDKKSIEPIDDDYDQAYIQRGKQSRFPTPYFLLFHIFLISTYTSLFAYLTKESLDRNCFEADFYYCRLPSHSI